ncbi:MAG: HNH endonuclease, partial [Acidimicrobiia bacterium]|nr:HNH endonuclease [Acidimicrobiia bacterium]
DDGQALLDRQRTKRKARIFESADSGMFVLSGEFDQITGARIATALTAKERQLWHREDPNDRATPQQRMADALAELICQPAADGRSAGTDLLVIADFDVLKQSLGNPRLADGSPIPIVELHRLALEANLLPSIFDTTAQDMWLGRRLRTASEAQRIALIARDQHCIGCAANPLWCRAHHIVWWSKNGPTDLDNLALVCDDCHHKIHDHGWEVHKHPKTGKYYLKPPNTDDPADPTRLTQHPKPSRATHNRSSRDKTKQQTRSSPRTSTRQSESESGSQRGVGVVDSDDPDRHVGSRHPESGSGDRNRAAGDSGGGRSGGAGESGDGGRSGGAGERGGDGVVGSGRSEGGSGGRSGGAGERGGDGVVGSGRSEGGSGGRSGGAGECGGDGVAGAGQSKESPTGAAKPLDPDRATRSRAEQPNGATLASDNTDDLRRNRR